MFGETGKDKEAVGVRVRVVAQREKNKKVLFTWVLLTGRTRKSVWGGEVSLALWVYTHHSRPPFFIGHTIMPICLPHLVLTRSITRPAMPAHLVFFLMCRWQGGKLQQTSSHTQKLQPSFVLKGNTYHPQAQVHHVLLPASIIWLASINIFMHWHVPPLHGFRFLCLHPHFLSTFSALVILQVFPDIVSKMIILVEPQWVRLLVNVSLCGWWAPQTESRVKCELNFPMSEFNDLMNMEKIYCLASQIY